MRTGFCRRLGTVLCTIASALWLMAGMFITSAASGSGSIELICRLEGEAVVGLTMNAYRVGELTEDSIELQGDFADYPVYIPELTSTALQDAAYSLENLAVLDGVKPYDTKVVYASGKITFTDLEDGIYLIAGELLSSGSDIYTPIPMLVEVKDGGKVTAYAKLTVRQKPTVDEDMYRVKKIWQYDDSYIQLRPVLIEVEIYRNNVLVETVELNDENDWTYDWTADTAAVWRVKEINITGDYKVVYRNNETQYILVNNRDVKVEGGTTTTTTTTTTSTTTTTTTTTVTPPNVSDTTTTTTVTTPTPIGKETTTTTTVTTTGSTVKTTTTSTTSTGKLPQTGQLWWPVPICGAGGLILFTAGWRLNKKK